MNEPTKLPQEPAEEYKVEELFLLHLRYKAALLEKLGNNAPVLLNDPTIAWVVYAGWVDLFAVPLQNGKVAGSREHLFRVPAGQALFGMALVPEVDRVGLLAVGSNNASLLQVKASQLENLARDEEFGEHVAALVDGWISNLSSALATVLPPKTSIRLELNQSNQLQSADTASARRGILWVRHARGKSTFMGNVALPVLNGTLYWPISSRTWLQAMEPSQLEVTTTTNFLQNGATGFGLAPFHRLILRFLEQWLDQKREEDKERLHNKVTSHQEMVGQALNHLAARFISPTERTAIDGRNAHPLLATCQLLGAQLGIEFKEPPDGRQKENADPLSEIARASRVQIRRVALKGEWWRLNHGPMLAFLAGDEEPKQAAALLPRPHQRYEMVMPSGEKRVVDEEVASTLHPFAFTFYRPFPVKALSLFDLVKFGLRHIGYDVRTIFLCGLVVSLLGLLIPIATGFIIDQIIPNESRAQLFQVSVLLVFVALASLCVQITQNVALLRLQGQMGHSIQAAMWDRLLGLPVSFFRDYTAGDLGQRVMGISMIERTLSSVVVQSLLTGVFSITSVLLLFWYDGRLALVAVFLVSIALAVTIIAGRVQVRYQRSLVDLQGQIAGIVLQTISGISKLRAAGVEGHAFASWAGKFSRYKQTEYEARETANRLTVFNAVFPLITSIVIFGMVTYSSQEAMSTGQFLAFNAAFVQFLAAVLVLGQAVVTILNIVPTYERAKPILETLPEVDEMKADPGELAGELEVSHVSFRYRADGPAILQDVSVQVKPGEFVALVGPSGSGKSTLFRLLLGFETPEAGAVYYNGRDLAGLDIREVRRQIGVVLQNGKLMAGDIFTNIVGSSLLTIEDARRAVRMAGMEDDIKSMPMGLHTVLSEGGGTLSGGQRQRLLIARALVHQPRILFFDEATSALDNRTQAIVSESLDNLQATRIVIAHRLSTIMNADRIYVLQDGRVAQQGTYDELIKSDGVFADLARRQMV